MLGTKVLEEKESSINGSIRVVKSLAFGTYIQIDNLTQSGGIVEDIWKGTIKRLKKRKIKNVLILGLGGGSAAKVVRKFWPKADILGIDIDPVIVDLGIKYLELNKSQVQIKIEDAAKAVKEFTADKKHFDLILIDLYKGYEYPKKFESEAFLKSIEGLLSDRGLAVFNRLYIGKERPGVMRFGKKLEDVFSSVEYFHPEANLMFICQ